MIAFDSILYIAQLGLVAGVFVSLIYTCKKHSIQFPWLAYTVLGWIVFSSVLALTGITAKLDSFPPPFMIFLFIQNTFLIWLIFFSQAGDFLTSISQVYLVGLQVFRLFVELILAYLAGLSLLPLELSYHGINFDILVGLLALPVAYLVFVLQKKSKISLQRKVLFVWNILGLALLFNIVMHGILSTPTTFQVFKYSVPTLPLVEFPMHLLPFFLVPVALSLHLVSLRKLYVEKDLFSL